MNTISTLNCTLKNGQNDEVYAIYIYIYNHNFKNFKDIAYYTLLQHFKIFNKA